MPDASTPTEPEGDATSAPAAEAATPAPEGDATPARAAEAATPAPEGDVTSAPAAEAATPAPEGDATPARAAEAATPAPEGDATPAPAAEAATPAPEGDATPARAAEQQRPRRRRPRGQGKGRSPRRGRPDRGSRRPRERGPLPFGELREAASAVAELFGPRRALREAFSVLGDKERADLARLVTEDGDWRARARNISAGSLGAGRVGKALAAQQVSTARLEDLWALTLSKEEAAERRARTRNARRRDERRAQREADRERSSDRVSRADLAKARDGRVGATIRIVMPGEPGGGRRRKGDDEGTDGGSDVLDRLGY